MTAARFYAFAALAGLLVPGVALAGGVGKRLVANEEQGVVYAVPLKSPFTVSGQAFEGVHFTGQAVVSGTYVFGRNAASEEEGTGSTEPDLYFVPDAKSVALLPRWNERVTVDGFYFRNAAAFLAAVVAPDIVNKVRAGRIKSVSGQMTIAIEGYFATVVCGTPAYSTVFAGVVEEKRVMASNDPAGMISCKG
jgi:hypothetical protein